MSPSRVREEARRLLADPRCLGVLPERAGLLWRTHDGGLAGFQEDRLEEALLRALRRLLGHGRQAAAERAALPVRLMYGLAAGGLRVSPSADAPATLPGEGLLVEVDGRLVCLSRDPLAALEALAEAEARGREAMLGRLLGSGDHPSAVAPPPQEPRAAGSCGRCSERGGLLGDGSCLGNCCARHS